MLAALVALVIYFAIQSAMTPVAPEMNRSEKIKAACASEFGPDLEEVRACEFGLLTKALEDDKRDLDERHRRAERAAGL